MTQPIQLLPCPFCGGEATFGFVAHTDREDDPNAGGEFVDCSQCQASTALVFPLKGDVKRELAERWNRRIGPHALGDTKYSETKL